MPTVIRRPPFRPRRRGWVPSFPPPPPPGGAVGTYYRRLLVQGSEDMIFVQSEATAARRRVWLYLVDATDGITAETGEAGGQPQLSKNGAAWANTSATLTAVGNGTYYVELTAAELDTLGKGLVRYKSAATAEFSVPFDVVAANVHDTVRLGLTALPNANAEAAGGLYTRGTGAGQINQPGNGLVDVNVENWNTTAVPAEHTAGYPIVTIKDGTGTGEINTNAGAIALVDLVTTTTTATNVTTVNGLAANVITAASMNADASAEIADAVWDEDATAHQTQGTFGQAIGDPAADSNTIYGAVVTGAAGATIAADVIAVQADTDDIQTRLPAALVSGRMDSSVGAVAANAITAAGIADGAIDRATFAADTGLQSIRSNTAQAGAAGSITLDASASSTTDFYKGAVVYLTGNTGAGQARLCTAYNGTTKVATTVPNWATNPDNTTTFAILPVGPANVLAWVGTAAVAGAVPSAAAGAANGLWILGTNAPAQTNLTGDSGWPALTLTGGSDSPGFFSQGLGAGAGAFFMGGLSGHGLILDGAATADDLHLAGSDAPTLRTAVWGHASDRTLTAATNITSTGGSVPITAGGLVSSDVTAISTDSTAADNLEAMLDGTGGVTLTTGITGNITGNLSGSVGSVTGNVGGNVVGSVASVTGSVGGNVTGSVGSIATDGITSGSLAASAITEIQAGLSTVTTAQVNAEVVDALATDTYAEPGQGAPAATASLVTKIGHVYKAWRNKKTQTSTTFSLFADDGTTVDQKATTSDDGTTATVGEVASGP